MKNKVLWGSFLVLLGFAVLPVFLSAQGTLADYERAANLRDRVQFLALNVVDRSGWIEKTPRFWYRKTVKGGYEFDVMDAATLTKKPAFDPQKLAAALSAAAGEKYSALNPPFQAIAFVDNEAALEFDAGDFKWRCTLADYACKKVGPASRRRGGGGGSPFVTPPAPPQEPKASPDGKWEAFIKNYNVWLRSRDKKDDFPLSWEGTEGDAYAWLSISWAPDSKKIAAYRIRPGYRRLIQYVESSPADQLQPKYYTYAYPKPGDALDVCTVALFQVDGKKQFLVDSALIPNPFWCQGVGPNPRQMPDAAWWKDSRAFTFEFNQRGHQVYRIIEVDAATGKARTLVNEENKTFISYSYKKYRYDVGDGKEIIWMSERDGWNHLYLFDGRTGTVKNQITNGEWVVRGVDYVDEAARQVSFRASGMVPGKDPYLIQSYRINFDGTGLTPLTEGDGNHTVVFSQDMKYYVETWSRVDLPPVTELRSSADRKRLAVVEKTDIQELIKIGWRTPEVFSAKARDGKSDIWGIILRPTNFDPKKKYPVIEYIYAGPHNSFVPKSFFAFNQMQSVAELGFIVAQVDGMGTSNRSKAFHDICWKNIGDAGFPDRILWHKAVAAKYPFYDISRVGIYGGSAGGQNSTGGVLFHPEFYKIAVSFAGCHDNRMDKLWWNEAWMGWPLGPEYAASSNVDNAYRLQGKLLLIVGELDTNVDPASTMQVVNALIKANKTFELLVIPGGSHGAGRSSEVPEYGERKRNDFFVHNLLGVDPPNWNKTETKK
ncbi:MAG: DPP IV N-terminal domain-containing protein [Candidatus Aminicenantes bacterium]|nr:DPP IV N-terminal domain-containing protein [Candidatus Aminicenantes bacterium]